ncbi:MAG: dipeptidyl-peptidase 3 family protein [Spirochaetaceae bacterium]
MERKNGKSAHEGAGKDHAGAGKNEGVRNILDSYIPVKLSLEDVPLPDRIKPALPYLKEAMDGVHEIFLSQQWEKYVGVIHKKMDRPDDLGEFYRRFQGPWYPVEDYKSYDPDVPDRVPGCSFYPEDMTAEEFRRRAGELESPTTKVVRGAGGRLEARHYHAVYAEKLAEVFDALEKASEILEDQGEPDFADYLGERAEALVSGRYHEADSAWVRLHDVPIELVLGPYEVYADALLGLKAMYEGMLMVVDHERCGRLKEMEEHLEEMSGAFPMPSGAQPAVGGLAPLVVVHQIYSAGEARQPIYPAAFNLPNDPWVRGNVGWKQVMLYNVMRAKFDNITVPLARRVMPNFEEPDFEPFFYEVILHEVSHGLGPAYRADGRKVDSCLGPHYTAIEEAKADTGGLFFLLEYGGSFGIPRFDHKTIFQGYAAAQFRSMRFGMHEAHGAAGVIAHNWMLSCGGFERTEEGYAVNPDRGRSGIKSLLEELCRLEAEAEQAEAAAFLEKWAEPDTQLLETMEKLRSLPVDLFLEFDV